MKFFDVGQEANGVIAIGQMATGFVAIGQIATGVIAVGQVARGFFAVGMLAYGFISIGMLSLGVFNAVGMIGLAGLGGKGLVLPLMPFPRADPFDAKKPEQVFAGHERGFVLGRFVLDADRRPHFEAKGSVTDARVVHELTNAARERAVSREPHVLAFVDRADDGSRVITRAIAVPPSAASKTAGFVIRGVSLAVMAAICAGFYAVVAIPLVEFLVSAK